MSNKNPRDKLKEIRKKLMKSKKAWTRSLPTLTIVPIICKTATSSKCLTKSDLINLGKCQLELILQFSSYNKNSIKSNLQDSFFHPDLINNLSIFENSIRTLIHPIKKNDDSKKEKLEFFDVIWNYFINRIVDFSSTKIPALLFSSSKFLQDEFVLQILSSSLNAFLDENSLIFDVLKEPENWMKIIQGFHNVFKLTNCHQNVISSLQSFTNCVQKTLEFDIYAKLYPSKFSTLIFFLDRLKRTKKPQLAKNPLIQHTILFLTNEFMNDFDMELGKFLLVSYPLLSSILKNIIKVKNDQEEFIHFAQYPHLFHIFYNPSSKAKDI